MKQKNTINSVEYRHHNGNGMLVNIILILLIVSSLIGFLLYTHITKPSPPAKFRPQMIPLVEAKKVILTEIEPQVEVYGVVESPLESDISAANSGDVIGVHVLAGESVKKGQMLVEIDNQEVRLRIAQLQSDVLDLKAQIESEENRHKGDLNSITKEKELVTLAERSLSRELQLKISNVTTDSRVDESNQKLQQQLLYYNERKLAITNHLSRLSQLQAKLARAEAQITLAHIELKQTQIVAPFDGKVIEVSVSIGERLKIGDFLLSIYDPSALEVRAQLPIRHLNKISSAIQRSKYISGNANFSYGRHQVELRRLAAKQNANGGGVDGFFRVVNESGAGHTNLVLGEVVPVMLNLPKLSNVLLLPEDAIFGNSRIYKIVDRKLHHIDIERVGYRYQQDKRYIIARSNELYDNDLVLITPLINAVDSLPVRLVGDPPPKPAMENKLIGMHNPKRNDQNNPLHPPGHNSTAPLREFRKNEPLQSRSGSNGTMPGPEAFPMSTKHEPQEGVL